MGGNAGSLMPAQPRPPESHFRRALRSVRRARGLSQEEFDVVSGRTYVSSLERGLKSPTLAKVDSLAGVLEVHPLTLLSQAYCRPGDTAELERLLDRVREEVAQLVAGGLE